ncbi:MAG: tRNA lysidine(34) synthetase TilS [Sulfuritalea sp.]|nr:tRNA lysidine(34) synthetase TilS [Polynucleobacter sp.]MCF8188309.1 tRNA lysidine(34) synthetase TilS [Sulfuritalea sp.]
MANSRKFLLLNNSQIAVAITAFERALEEILARVVLSDGASIAIACSGGLDSAVLLHLSADFFASHPHLHSHSLHVFHVHHGLSPNADYWLSHVQSECEQLNVPFDARKVSVARVDQHGPENAARLARYEALANLCTVHRVELLLTAHHQDDQAETVMLQALRGAGLPGWSGMADLQRDHALLPTTVTLARPLLDCSRKQLEQIASERAIAHIIDESNEDSRYKRNAIRHEIFPLIEQHFEGFTQALARSSHHFQTAQGLLDELACSDLQQCLNAGELNLKKLALLSVDRIDNLLRYWVVEKIGSYPSQAQLHQLHQQMLHAATDTHPQIVIGQWVLQREHDHLIIRAQARVNQPPMDAVRVVWQGERQLDIPEWRGQLVFEDGEGEGFDRDLLLQGPLTLRPRQGGERLKLDGRRPSRSLKNLFQESGVAAGRRPWLPLLYAGEQLLFACGLGPNCIVPEKNPGIRLHWQAWSADNSGGNSK